MGASALPLVLACLVQPVASADSPADPSSYDAFDAVTANPESPPGTEVPYTGSEPFAFITPSDQVIDTSGFTLQDGESGDNGCVISEGQAVFAGRTAWLRFDPDVDGQLLVRAITPGYDSVVVLHRLPDTPWKQADLSLLTNIECTAEVDGPGNEQIGSCDGVPCLQLGAGFAYYVQVGGRCPGTNDPTTCTDPATPGGSTRIQVSFVPDDSDGDGVPDTRDDCVDQGGQVADDGCPDLDGDNISDGFDDCDSQAGVAADPPYNGCPAGPIPPPGVVGAAIVGSTGSTDVTATAQVRLALVWPKGATHYIASNNGIDYSAPQPLAASVPWKLKDSDVAVTRQVHVKFVGNLIDPDNAYSPIILLDPVAPGKREALVARTWDGRFAVRLRLSDGQGSGVRILRLGGQSFRCAPVSSPACRSYRLSRQFGRAVTGFKAVDYAGNNTGTQGLRRVLCPNDGQLPVYPYPEYRGSVPYGCFRIGQEITRKVKRKFDFPSVNLATSRVRPGVFRVRKG